MAFFFTDSNGTRQEVSQTLVNQGIITRETPIESDRGQKGMARQIPGLQFPETSAVTPPTNTKTTVLYQYKCVAAPRVMVSQRSDDAPAKAVADFSDFINSGCAGGWEYYAMEEMEVHEAEGCLIALFRMIPVVGQVLSMFIREPGAFHYNVLIFRKQL
ncbi:hypothetical protein FACS189443_7130 [Planctomycetales bacterium]|nr:hypothetical protein FACS189443_7130 [Planctomycetales bacterium]